MAEKETAYQNRESHVGPHAKEERAAVHGPSVLPLRTSSTCVRRSQRGLAQECFEGKRLLRRQIQRGRRFRLPWKAGSTKEDGERAVLVLGIGGRQIESQAPAAGRALPLQPMAGDAGEPAIGEGRGAEEEIARAVDVCPGGDGGVALVEGLLLGSIAFQPIENRRNLPLGEVFPVGHALLFELLKEGPSNGITRSDHRLRGADEGGEPKARPPLGDTLEVGPHFGAFAKRVTRRAAAIENELGIGPVGSPAPS